MKDWMKPVCAVIVVICLVLIAAMDMEHGDRAGKWDKPLSEMTVKDAALLLVVGGLLLRR